MSKTYPDVSVVKFADGTYGLRRGIFFHSYLELADFNVYTSHTIFYKKNSDDFKRGRCSVSTIEQVREKYMKYYKRKIEEEDNKKAIKLRSKREQVVDVFSEFK